MSSSPSTVRTVYFIVLPNGTCIRKDLYDELRREVDDALKWLPQGVKCRIEHLVTPKFWLPKHKALRRGLGRCLAYWVSNGELPLEFVGPWYAPNKKYRRRAPG